MNIEVLTTEDGIFIMDKDNFRKFTKENNLIIFEEKLNATKQDFYISEEDLMSLLDFNEYLFKLLETHIVSYNEQVDSIDFNKPVGINYYTIFEGVKFIYQNWFNDFLLSKVEIVNRLTNDSNIVSEKDIKIAQENRENDLNEAIENIFNLMKLDEKELAFVMNEKDRRYFTRNFLNRSEVIEILQGINIEDMISFEWELMRKIKGENIYYSDYYKELRSQISKDETI